MEKKEVLEIIQRIFREIFDDDSIELSANTTTDDIEDWDSLTHIQIVVTIQKEIGVKFSSTEIHKWANVGEMCDSVLSKLLVS